MRRKRSRKKEGGSGWTTVKICPTCGKPQPECRCFPSGDAEEEARSERGGGSPGTVRLRMERRRGKPVSIAAASGVAQAELRSLLKELKTACGVGGTLKGTDLELQGEHRERLRAVLRERGYTVKG